MSTHATVVLKGLGTSKTVIRMHLVLVICSNICMFFAFCLWSTEGIVPEVVTCSVVSIIRPVMLMKTSPYLNRFPECIQNAVKALALPLYNSIKTISACSFFFANIGQIPLTAGCIVIILTLIALVSFINAALLAFNGVWIRLIVSLDLLNTALFGLLLSSTKDYFECEYCYSKLSQQNPYHRMPYSELSFGCIVRIYYKVNYKTYSEIKPVCLNWRIWIRMQHSTSGSLTV
ncbi:uncharacterized protein LOC124396631 isoform X5 [Silurus meridionalis]|uniref:uncharacterized protein LOC124396631 isoform X5 n=1 Tax=Silurus meridionalis TaxID=175797 RepID=UPI001EEB043A|nr:uncharacterized protein LOC124396631 isoform X5 [Silurus meridionalis]